MAVLETLSTTEPPAKHRFDRRERVLLGVLLGTQFMLAVDFSILNVALPTIGRGVGLSLANLQWAATAFALPAAGLTLLFGRIADLFGRRRLFFTGLMLLAFGSILGGCATDPQVLLTARVLQGLAAAMATPAALSLLTTAFSEGPRRDRALGLNGALLSSGFTTGALVGGLLTSTLSWRWAFLINVPVALTVLVIGRRVLVEPPKGERAKLDVPGALTVSLGLLALVYGLTTAGAHGWGDPAAVVTLVAAAVLLTAFWRIEHRAAQPLAPVRILERQNVKWGNLGGLVVFSMESAVVFLLTLYLQRVLGMSALTTGFTLGFPGLSAIVAGLLAPRALARFGRRGALVGGLVVQAASNAVLLLIGTAHWGVALIVAALCIGFFGHITAIVAYTVTATSGLPDDEQGLATGLATLTQQVALALGIPILSTIVIARSKALAGRGAVLSELGGVHLALAADVAVTLLAAAAIWWGLRHVRTGNLSAMAGPVALVGSGEYLPVMEAVERGLLQGRPQRFVQLATAAAPEGQQSLNRWYALGRAAAERLGVEQVVVPVIDRESADDPDLAALVEGAGLVYLSGGNPTYLAATLRDTKVWAAIAEAWDGGAALAGCSAGAMAMALRVPDLRHPLSGGETGLGTVPQLSVIPHFDRMARRIPDFVLNAVTHAPTGVTVVGIDEETALVGGPDDWVVAGRQQVWLLTEDGRQGYAAGERLHLPASPELS